MKILTLSNLYPRPDQPTCGMFNAQLFGAMAQLLPPHPPSPIPSPQMMPIPNGTHSQSLTNICLVPEWRLWRWSNIRTWRDPRDQPFQTYYFPVHYVPVIGRDLSWRTYRSSLRSITPAVSQADVVYSTWLYPDGVVATALAAEFGKPSWIMVQGSDTFHLRSRCRRRVILEACRQAAGLICVCRALADRLSNAGVDPEKLHVVPNGVDTSLFYYRSPEEARRALTHTRLGDASAAVSILRHSDTPTPRYILFIGNLVPVKGPDLLLDVFGRMQEHADTEATRDQRTTRTAQRAMRNADRPDLSVSRFAFRVERSRLQAVHLVVIGDGPMRRELEGRARRDGIEDAISFLGVRPHDEIALWMNVADCLCLPSRSEGMPNVVLEALASGLPVVAFDVGACAEMLKDHVCSTVVPAGDAPAMAQALQDVLAGRGENRGVTEPAMRYSWRDQATHILDLIRKSVAAKLMRESAETGE